MRHVLQRGLEADVLVGELRLLLLQPAESLVQQAQRQPAQREEMTHAEKEAHRGDVWNPLGHELRVRLVEIGDDAIADRRARLRS
jgi:hypothetical protein